MKSRKNTILSLNDLLPLFLFENQSNWKWLTQDVLPEISINSWLNVQKKKARLESFLGKLDLIETFSFFQSKNLLILQKRETDSRETCLDWSNHPNKRQFPGGCWNFGGCGCCFVVCIWWCMRRKKVNLCVYQKTLLFDICKEIVSQKSDLTNWCYFS